MEIFEFIEKKNSNKIELEQLLSEEINNRSVLFLIEGEVKYTEIKDLYFKIKNNSNNVKIVCLDDLTKHEMQNDSLQCYGRDDYPENFSQYAHYEILGYRLSETWFDSLAENNEKNLIYRGISLGKAIVSEAKNDISFVLDLIRFFKKLFTEKFQVTILLGKKNNNLLKIANLIKKFVRADNKFFYICLNPNKKSVKLIQNFLEIFNFVKVAFPFMGRTKIIKLPIFFFSGLKNIYTIGRIIENIFSTQFDYNAKKSNKKILLSDPGSFTYIGRPFFEAIFNNKKFQVYILNSFKNFSPNDSRYLKNIILFKIPERWKIFKTSKIKKEIIDKWDKSKIWENKELWSVEGFYFGDFIDQNFREKWLDLMLKIAIQFDLYFYLFEKYQFDAVLTHTGYTPFIRSLILVAKKKKIPVFEYQHGTAYSVDGFFPAVSDYFWVWGKTDYKFFVKNGIPPNKIEITGNIMSDQLKKIENQIPSNKYVIVSACQVMSFSFPRSLFNPFFYNIECAKGTIELAKYFPDVTFIFKIRMWDCAKLLMPIYTKMFKESGLKNIKTLNHNYGFFEKLAGADAVILRDSGMGIEAAMMGIPIIQVTFGIDKEFAKALIAKGYLKDLDLVKYAELGAAILAESVDALPGALWKIYNDPVTKENLKKGRKIFLEEYSENNTAGASICCLKNLEKVLL